jgi:chromosome segregation ATPase
MTEAQKKTGIKAQRSNTSIRSKMRIFKTSNRILLTFLVILNLVMTIILGVWIYSFYDNQFQTGKGLQDRILSIESNLEKGDDSLQEIVEDIDVHLDLLDNEVRKLWDLSNKRNRNSILEIQNYLDQVKETVSSIRKSLNTNSAKLRTKELEIKSLNKSLRELKTSFVKFSSSNPQDKFFIRLKDIEGSIDAINGSRIQMNKRLINLSERIDKIELENLN